MWYQIFNGVWVVVWCICSGMTDLVFCRFRLAEELETVLMAAISRTISDELGTKDRDEFQKLKWAIGRGNVAFYILATGNVWNILVRETQFPNRAKFDLGPFWPALAKNLSKDELLALRQYQEHLSLAQISISAG